MSWFGLRRPDAPPARAALPGRPLQLVAARDDGTFTVGEDAAAALTAIRGPVGVVAVAGRARQGKSYLLNKLVGAATGGGFAVSPSHRPCTKGLWLWSSPVPTTDTDGRPYHLILIDTEGIDAFDQTTAYSTHIFALAILLSSTMVYNQIGGIDEAALDRLSLVTEVTKLVRARADESGIGGGGGGRGDGGAATLAPFTPNFLWLLRDFYLDLADETGRRITPGDYLEAALAPVPHNAPGAAGKNGVRSAIKQLFPRRDCAALVRPAADERDLQNLDSLPAASLRPEFVKGLDAVTHHVFDLASPKRIGAAVLTGPALAGLTRAYVAALNAGAVPTIATAWQGVAEQECRGAADDAEGAYRTAFSAAGGDAADEEASLDAAHASALEVGAAAFAARAVGEGPPREAGDKKWRATVAAAFAAHKTARLAAAELACQRLIGEAGAAVAAYVASPGATAAGLSAKLAQMEKAYAAAPAGGASATKWRLWARFVGGQSADAARGLAEREAAAARARADAAAGAVAAAAARAEAAERELAGARSDTASRVATLEAALASARAQGGDAAAAASARADAAERALAAERAAAAAARAESDGLRRQLAAAQAEVARVQAAAAAKVAGAKAAAAAAAAAPPPPPPTHPADNADFMDAGDEPTPDTMTVAAIKQWLTDAGHDGEVWRLAGAKARKAEWVAAMKHVMRR